MTATGRPTAAEFRARVQAALRRSRALRLRAPHLAQLTTGGLVLLLLAAVLGGFVAGVLAMLAAGR